MEQIQFVLTQFLDRRTILFGLGVIPFIGRTAQGEDFPTRPIRLVVPFGAGSVADIVARKVGEKAGATLKQSFVIENQYRGRLTLYHVDLYRLERAEPELWESLQEHMYADGVTAVEWAERLPAELRDGAALFGFELDEPGRRVLLNTREERLSAAASQA